MGTPEPDVTDGTDGTDSTDTVGATAGRSGSLRRTGPAPGPGPARGQAPVLAAVALGGAIGATARYGAGLIHPTAAGSFPWTTLLVNVAGCAVIGVFMVLISEVWAAHRLVRPFFGTGVLGGFTTFSTYAVEIQRLMAEGRTGTAMTYLAATVFAALAAVWTAAAATRRLIAPRRAPRPAPVRRRRDRLRDRLRDGDKAGEQG